MSRYNSPINVGMANRSPRMTWAPKKTNRRTRTKLVDYDPSVNSSGDESSSDSWDSNIEDPYITALRRREAKNSIPPQSPRKNATKVDNDNNNNKKQKDQKKRTASSRWSDDDTPTTSPVKKVKLTKRKRDEVTSPSKHQQDKRNVRRRIEIGDKKENINNSEENIIIWNELGLGSSGGSVIFHHPPAQSPIKKTLERIINQAEDSLALLREIYKDMSSNEDEKEIDVLSLDPSEDN